MISVTQVEDRYEIRFKYDPEIVELVKQVPGRQWNPDAKFWSIPTGRLGMLMAQFKGTRYESDIKVFSNEDINKNSNIESADIPEIDVSDHKFRVNSDCKIFDHQVDTLKYDKYRCTHGIRSGFLLADQPGMGKTLSVMNIAFYHKEHFNCKHCLIICCVNSAKYNWREDILKHTNGEETPYILGSRIKRGSNEIRLNGSGKEKTEDLATMKMFGGKTDQPLPYFIIMNIEAIRTKIGRTYIVSDILIDLINSGEIGLIALDEIHKNASMSSQQGKQLLRIKKSITKQIEWIPMTGTPITSRPTDVFLPLRLVDGHSSNSYYNWCQNFCLFGGYGDHEILGYKNISMLKNMLQPNMLRRLKDNVLDLPPKVRYIEYVENTEYQDKLYKSVLNDVRDSREQIVHSLNPLSQFLKLRQVNGSPELIDENLKVDDSYLAKNSKLLRLLELIDDIVENDEKVVIFSNWVQPLRTLHKFISRRYKTCCYTGTMSQEDRELHKKAFIENPDYKVMIGTIGALGTSHTLTVARNIIFYDMPWNPSEIEQAEDRCHRPGTSQSVSIYTLITKGTVDEKVYNILKSKESTAKFIVDNNLDIRSNPELFDMLIS